MVGKAGVRGLGAFKRVLVWEGGGNEGLDGLHLQDRWAGRQRVHTAPPGKLYIERPGAGRPI